MDSPPLAEVAAARLGQPVVPWLTAQRAELGSWDKAAAELNAATGLDVSRETVRRWVNTANEAEAAA